MKKMMLTLAAVFCCAMSLIMFTACGSDDGDDSNNTVRKYDVTPVAAMMECSFEVSDDMLSVLDMTIEYYDNDGKLQTEKLTQKNWAKTVKAKLPASLGARLKAQMKDGVDVNSIGAVKFLRRYSYKGYPVNAAGEMVSNVQSGGSNSTVTLKGEDLHSVLSEEGGVVVAFLYNFAENGKAAAGSWK